MPDVTPDACPWCYAYPYVIWRGKIKSIECTNPFCPVKPKIIARLEVDCLEIDWNASIAENRARGMAFPAAIDTGRWRKRVCPICNKIFEATRSDKVYCSDSCGRAHAYQKRKKSLKEKG